LHLRSWLPSRGNVLFTLVVVAGLLWASNAGALPLRIPSAAGTSTGTIAYQGRLADSAGNPITDTVNMEFRLYNAPTGGTPLWDELWTGANAVRVSDGLFNVMLGSLNAISQNVIAGHDQLWLGITVGTDDEMTPRVQLGSVPFAVQALTVPDGSVTTAKIVDGAVNSRKLKPNTLFGNADGPATINGLGNQFFGPGSVCVEVASDVLVLVTLNLYTESSAGQLDFHVKRDGTQVGSTFHQVINTDKEVVTIAILDSNVGPGCHNYDVWGEPGAGGLASEKNFVAIPFARR